MSDDPREAAKSASGADARNPRAASATGDRRAGREARLAEALRANLRRRKAAARAAREEESS